jgi:hypothetical protein
VFAGETVRLTAELSGSSQPSSVKWSQVVREDDPIVELIRVDALRARFVAPQVAVESRLEFTLEYCGIRQGRYVPPQWICGHDRVLILVSPQLEPHPRERRRRFRLDSRKQPMT